MSSEFEVLEGGVSKKAVFGGQEHGDDVRVVREAARADQGGRLEDVDFSASAIAVCVILQSSLLHRLHPSTSSTFESQRTIYIDELSSICQAEFIHYIDQETNKIK